MKNKLLLQDIMLTPINHPGIISKGRVVALLTLWGLAEDDNS